MKDIFNRNYKAFFKTHSENSNYTDTKLTEKEVLKLKRYCRSHFVYSGHDNKTSFMIDCYTHQLYVVYFKPDNIVSIRSLPKCS